MSNNVTTGQSAVEPVKESEFPADEYNKMLDLILKAAQDEYKQITYDTPANQRVILRNYQWLATVILAVQGALFGHVITGREGFWPFPWQVMPTVMFYVWAVFAVLCCLTVFTLGLDTLRGRGITLFPYQRTYSDLLVIAYNEARKQESLGCLRATMVRDLEAAISNQRKKAKPVGPRLRIMSWGLLLALLCTVFAVIPNIIFVANQAQKEVISMSDPKNTPESPLQAAKPPSPTGQGSSGSLFGMATEGLTSMEMQGNGMPTRGMAMDSVPELSKGFIDFSDHWEPPAEK